MYCNFQKDDCVKCKFNLKNFGVHDLERVTIDGSDRRQLNWSEISVPEILQIPCEKPNVEQLDQVFVDAKLTSVKLIETPFAYKSYDRIATDFEITSGENAIADAMTVNNNTITVLNDADAVLEVPPSVVPEVTLFEEARDATNAANSSLVAAVTEANIALSAATVCASDIVTGMESIIATIEVLQDKLVDLVAKGEALEAASATDISSEIEAMNGSIVTTQTSIEVALERLTSVVSLVGNTKYFEIIENEEGTCLSGRKLVIEGVLNQKVVYTGLVKTQSVHSACYEVPFTAYIIPYAKFEGLNYEEDVTVILEKTDTSVVTININGFAYNPNKPIEVDIFEEFSVDVHIEDIFAKMLDCRTVFKNITLFFIAKSVSQC